MSSLKINVLNWFAESSHQSGNPKGIHCSFLVYIVVVPCLIKSKFHEFWKFIALESKMLLNNLVSNDLSLILKNKEFFIWFSFSSNTFSCILFNHHSSECINCNIIARIIVSWEFSCISFFPFSTIVIVADKSGKTCVKTSKVTACFFNSSKSNIWLVLNILVITIRVGIAITWWIRFRGDWFIH